MQYSLDPSRDDWCREIYRVETDSNMFVELDVALHGMQLRVLDTKGRVYCLLTNKQSFKKVSK